MGWPQITMIALLALGLGASIADHGKPRSAQNAWVSLISTALMAGLLYAGGFFAAS